MNNFFKNKNVLITGHTGFKGSWLTIWLLKLGAKVTGISLTPYTLKDNFVLCELDHYIDHHILDIRDKMKLKRLYNRTSPDIVFHLAAQPLVQHSYSHPAETFDVNINGTVNILECARNLNRSTDIIVITSDKCYANQEWIWGYRESDKLGGHDPYSASKSAVEIICNSYRKSFFNDYSDKFSRKSLATARAGNVIGGGDWQKNRLIPDCIKALEGNQAIPVRNPQSIRPWQHVLEPLYGYLQLAYHLNLDPEAYASSWNFGPAPDNCQPVSKLVEYVIEFFGSGSWKEKPDLLENHEAGILKLDTSKTVSMLGCTPTWNFKTSIENTVSWYKSYKSINMYQFALDQIAQFSSDNYQYNFTV